LLGILEVLLILMLTGGVLYFKLRSARRDAAALRVQLQQAVAETRPAVVEQPVPAPAEPAEPQRDYADFLREQLQHSSLLLGEDTSAQSEDEHTRQMLAARHQFLQLELDVQGVASTADEAAQRQTLIAGMQALLDGLRNQTQDNEPPVVAAETGQPPEAPTTRSDENRLQDQITHLRTVIDNQHDVMRELRHLLEEHGGESEELQEALRKLSDAEAQAIELQRCLEVMEHENEQLQDSAARALTTGVATSPDADMLRDLVGSQQRTIGKLQHMLRSLGPDSGKARELDEAIDKIQRANMELNSCVMVLEDENAMLRGQVESLQERIADLEAQTAPEQSTEVGDEAGSEEDLNALWESALAQQATGELEDISAPQPQEAAVAFHEQAAVGDQPVADDQPMETDDLLAELFGTARDTADDKKAG
jgi:uncharacterized coiled-coil protein SlyX